uniref:BAG family molecular chaperone regulator 2 n=2 Tax=Timema TaxID=61471 RepID=A0A7R9EHK5_9NEOP|nr:unnamed protein product [Timema cristinae]CAD7433098.1 unnamed protein product [Timema monikensis]
MDAGRKYLNRCLVRVKSIVVASKAAIPLPYSDNWNMEIDKDWQGCSEADSSSQVPQIIEANPDSPQKSPKDRLIDLFDQVEKHVERMRRDALRMEEEKDILLTTLDTLRNSEMMIELDESEREEVNHFAEHIVNRCLTVEVHVKTTRDPMQEDSLHQVNSYIDSLVVSLREDPTGTKTRCVMFMNACSSQAQGAADKNFEAVILGCTLDDQKRIKKRLQGLLDYIDTSTRFG